MKNLRLFASLSLMLILAESGWCQTSFRARGLARVPTADTLAQGRLLAAIGGSYDLEEPRHRAATELTFDIGLASWLQGGVAWQRPRETDASQLLWDWRVRLVREAGGRPGIALAVTGLGEGRRTSASYLLVSQELNLPHVGFFQVLVGARQSLDPSFADGDTAAVAGASKWWKNRAVRVSGEWDGDAFNVGGIWRVGGGLRVAVGVEANTPRLLFSVGFENGPLIRQIEAAQRNAKVAIRRAAEVSKRIEEAVPAP